jgi:hypothetical protein
VSFKLYECEPDGLPLVEVPGGKYIYERLSPGTIKEADYFDTFRWVARGNSRVLLAKSKDDPDGPMRLLRVRHSRKGLKKILRECRSGKLSERRQKDIDRVQNDISGLSGLGGSASLLGTGFLVALLAAFLFGLSMPSGRKP